MNRTSDNGTDSLSINHAIDYPFVYKKSTILCQAHTGYWGQYNRNKKTKQVEKDWLKMVSTFKKL